MDEKKAWKVFNFIREWQQGHFGIVSLQEALDSHFDGYEQPKPLTSQIGDM